jgi:Zn-dependent protease with chaperone function
MRRLHSHQRVLLLSLAFLLACAAAVAQDYEEDDEGYPQTAVLSLYVQPDGNTRADFYSPTAFDQVHGLREALGTALHCNQAAFHSPEYSTGVTDPQQREQIRRAQRQASLHQLNAICPSLVNREGLRRAVNLQLSPVLAALKTTQVKTLTVAFVSYRAPNLHLSHESLRPVGTPRYGMLNFQVPVQHGDAQIEVTWGYQRSDLFWPLLSAAAFVLFPSALILWMRVRALHLHTTDRAGAWFSYIRTQHLCLTGALLVWIGGGYSTRGLFTSIMSAAWGSGSFRAAIVSLLYIFLPPLTVLVVSVLASYRVLVEVRQVSWTFRDFLQLQFAQVGMVIFPILGIYGGIQLLGSLPWLALTTIALSILMLPLSVHIRRKLTGAYPEPVTSGEFHDRIFLLARRAGVTLKSIFVMPSGKLPVANAFAAGNGIVMVTDYILQKLSRREIEAVAAHEIGHLQYKHPQKLAGAFVGIILLPMMVRSLFPAVIDLVLLLLPGRTNWGLLGSEDALFSPALDFVIAGICLVGFYALSRRFERIADARSVTLTDDPEALITAFVKLSLLNLTPMQWGRASGALTTHPSTLKRVARIARLGNVPEERLQQLLSEPTRNDTATSAVELFESPLPASARVYPAHQQLQKANLNLLLLVGISTAVPTIFAYLAATFRNSQWAILFVGILATFATYLCAVRWRIVERRDSLREKFLAHFSRQYPDLDVSSARLVGYSPEPWPRFYYVQSHWDTGLLIPTREGILYLGDQSKFLLSYPAIQEMVFDQGISSWWKFRRSYIRWSQQGALGVMNLLALDPCSLWSIESGNRSLHTALERWTKNPEVHSPSPSELATLTPPAPVQLKSKTPREAYPLKAVTKLVLLAAVAGVLVANATLTLWPMIYVPAIVFLLRIVESIPYRRYKDRPLSAEWTASIKPVENKAAIPSAN